MDSTLQKIRSSSYRPSRSISRSHAGSVASSRMGSVGPPSVSESVMTIGGASSGGGGTGADQAESVKEGVVELTRNSKYAVLQLPAVPSVLKSTEDEVYGAAADQNTGHALVMTTNTTYVWRYTSPEHVPTSIPFQYPESPKGTQSLLVAPSSGSREPGLVTVVSDSGLCTYWEAVGRAVADGLLHRRKSIEHKISLYSGEVIENFEAIEPAGIIVTTSSGRFIFVTLRDQFGKPYISSNTMTSRTQGFLSSIKGAISLAPYRRDIVSIKPGPFKSHTDRQALIISTNGDLSVWECLRTGQTKVLFDNSLKEVLINYISGVYPHAAESFSVNDIEVFEEQESIFILASFIQSLDQIFYVLYTVSLGDGNEVKIVSAHRLQTYTSDSTQQPRLILPKASQTLFIVFSNAVVLVDTVPRKSKYGVSTRWEDVVSFYSNVEIIGASAEDQLVVNHRVVRHSGVVLIAINVGVIRIEKYNEIQEKEFGKIVVTEQQLESQLARSTIEQAIFYGSKSDAHYVDFNVRREIEFDQAVLEKAFLDISAEILNTTSSYMPPVLPSMKDHLDLRVSYLAGLAEYLHHNFHGLVSVETRFALLTDLEKANAGRALWQHVDNKLQQSITEDNIVSLVIGTMQTGDALRDWFLHEISHIEELLIKICAYCSNHPDISLIIEANTICLQTIYDSALGIRNNYYGPVYGLALDEFSNSQPWTSNLLLVESFETQYEVTRKIPNPTDVVKNQLVCLVESLCSMYNGRVCWLQSKDQESKNEADLSEKKYIEKRSNWLETLTRIDCKDSAIKIAEQYHIYRSLCEIMVKDWKDARVAHETELADSIKERLHIYMDQFGYEFAYTLFQYLVDIGQLKILLTEFPTFDDYLEKYLSSGKHGKISWIHDISKRNYKDASKTLANVGLYSEEFNSNKNLQLSLAKLTALACDDQNLVQEVGKQMQVVQIQDSLVDQVIPRIGDNSTEYEIYTDSLRTSKIYRAFVQVLERGLMRIVQKRALGIDELIDALTLLPPSLDLPRNFYRAFKLISLSSSQVDSYGRLNEKIIWRRLLLVDDWPAIVNTKKKSDKKVKEITESTTLYQALLLMVENEILSPFGSQVLDDPTKLCELTTAKDWITSRYSFADERLQVGIAESFDLETRQIEILINDYGLASWTKGIHSRVTEFKIATHD